MNEYEIIISIIAIPLFLALGYSIVFINQLSDQNKKLWKKNKDLHTRIARQDHTIEWQNRRYSNLVNTKYRPMLTVVRNEMEVEK